MRRLVIAAVLMVGGMTAMGQMEGEKLGSAATAAATQGAGMESVAVDMKEHPARWVDFRTKEGAGKAEVIGEVNTDKIDEAKFRRLLRSVAGVRVFTRLVDLMIVEQACVSAGVDLKGSTGPAMVATAFDKRVQAEQDRHLAEFGGRSEAERAAAMHAKLRREGVTNVEFQMDLRRDACLRALGDLEGVEERAEREWAERRLLKLREEASIRLNDEELAAGYAKSTHRADAKEMILYAREAPSARREVAMKGPYPEFVNRQEIDGGKFDQLLMEVAGAAMFEQVVDLMVCEQACLQAGIAVDGAEFQKIVQAELERVRGDRRNKDAAEAAGDSIPGWRPVFTGFADNASPLALRKAACLRLLAKGKDLRGLTEDAWMAEKLKQLRIVANIRVEDPIIAAQYAERIKSIQAAASMGATTVPAGK